MLSGHLDSDARVDGEAMPWSTIDEGVEQSWMIISSIMAGSGGYGHWSVRIFNRVIALLGK